MRNKGIQLLDSNDGGEIGDLKIQVKRDESGKIVQGIIVGETLEQNIALILISHQGEFKFNPDLGVGIGDLLLSSDYLVYRHRIREHLAKDRLNIKSLDLYENKPLKIEASYND